MITAQDLARELARRDPGAWSVVERVRDLAIATDHPPREHRDHRTRLTLLVHQDVPRGRGSARLDLAPSDGSAAALVDQAISLALTAVGPAWASPPPAAPARVDLVDPDLVERELGAVARSTLARLRRPDALTLAATITVLREKVTVLAGSGFHASWLATDLRGDVLASLGRHSFAISRRARRGADFDLDAALASAAADLQLLASAGLDAGPPAAGTCALWLGPDAILPPAHAVADGAAAIAPAALPAAAITADAATATAADHGLWTIFAQLADAAIERQGLTRYRLHGEIARGAGQLDEPLSVTSDGALDFAALSVPVSEEAVAIRRFPLIERGIAIGLGLSPREAALRRTDPNGGVRNLVVAPGSWSPAPSPTARTLEIRRLHAIAIDPDTGHATLDIAFGLDHRPGRSTPTPFTGGTVHLDLVAALAHARRSANLLRRAAYHGPAAIFIDAAELIS